MEITKEKIALRRLVFVFMIDTLEERGHAPIKAVEDEEIEGWKIELRRNGVVNKSGDTCKDSLDISGGKQIDESVLHDYSNPLSIIHASKSLHTWSQNGSSTGRL